MTYMGSFKNNKPCGDGRWVFTNGSELTGAYKQLEVANDDDDGGDDENKGPAPVKLQWCSDS